MIRYAISDRTLYPGEEQARQASLIRQAVALANEGVEYFQLREKDLSDDALLALTIRVRDAIRGTRQPMRLVLNGPRPIAERAGIAWHGTPAQESGTAHPLSCSVHTLGEVDQHRAHTSLLLFAPVFGKSIAGEIVHPGVGLQQLRRAVERAGGTPVLALGGITLQNAPFCLQAGAAGIAGIRLFHR